MKIEKKKLCDLKRAIYNPRIALKPGDPEFEKLRQSIREFGMVQLLVWNKRTGTLVGGHQRLAVLLDEGLEEADVCVVDLDHRKEQALCVALNKIQGAWDEEKLAVLLHELSEIPNFEVGLTGFETPEISRLFDEFFAPDLDATEEPPETDAPPITQKGDLIELGPHRLLCGDSTSSDDLKILLGDKMIDLWITDFPYGIAYNSENRPREKKGKAWLPIQNDNLNPEDHRTFLGKSIECIRPFLKKGTPVYLWNGFLKMGCMDGLLEESGIHIGSMIVWVKPNPSISFADYNWQTEFCAYGWVKGDSHKWYGDASESNLWECPRDAAKTLVHPTTKPVALAQRAVKNSSQRGDIVFDGFAGSGSTLIAAQSMERVCYAVELEPSYCDSIVRRFIKVFGSSGVSPDIVQRYWKEA